MARRIARCASPTGCGRMLDIDDELIDHARAALHRIVLAAIDEVARTFVEGLDRDGWREVLLAAPEVTTCPTT